jgi:hypothetical protein
VLRVLDPRYREGLLRRGNVAAHVFLLTSEIWNLYAKNIIFAWSLPISTSTWHSNHCNRPSGYMHGELKSENINKIKAPT